MSVSDLEDPVLSSAKYDMEWIGDQMDQATSPGFIKVGTWNVRRGLLTVKSLSGQRSTLDWLMDMMDATSCDIMAIQEPNCSTSAIRANLRPGFHVFGFHEFCQTIWLTKDGWGAHVRAIGSGRSGRILAISLSGRNASNMLLVNYYGLAGSSSDSKLFNEHEKLIKKLEELDARLKLVGSDWVILGDFNLALRHKIDSNSASRHSCERFQQMLHGMHMVSAFPYSHSNISREHGAFTYIREGTSLIDHICAKPSSIGKCGIGITGSFLSDHRMVVAEIYSPVQKCSNKQLKKALEGKIFNSMHFYDLWKIREYESTKLIQLEFELAQAVEASKIGQKCDINMFATRIQDEFRSIEKSSGSTKQKIKPKSCLRGTDRRIQRMLINWSKAADKVGILLKNDFISARDFYHIEKIMWGRSQKWEDCRQALNMSMVEWSELQLPYGACLNNNEHSENNRKQQAKAWSSWLHTVRTVISQCHKKWRKRSQKWWRWFQTEKKRELFDEVDDGYTSQIFQMIFPEAKPGEPLAFLKGDDWITDPAEVADEVAEYMFNLTEYSSFTRPYDINDPQSQKFTEGPWMGEHRIPAEFMEIICSQRCSHIKDKLRSQLSAISFEEYLYFISKKSHKSASGISGVSYGILKCLPILMQKCLWHVRNLAVLNVELPTGMSDLPIVVIPKLNTTVTGYTATRPISLYEAELKVITGTVHKRVASVLESEGILHPNQFCGRRFTGVHESLQFILHSLELAIRSGQKVFLCSLDIKGAFPSTMHWFLEMVMDGYDMPKELTKFFLMADSAGQFCIRTRQCYSKWIRKGYGGIGQGEQGSPDKFKISGDPLLWRLEAVCHLGLWVGEGFEKHIEKFPTDLIQFVVFNGWLVAISFADDMQLVSGDQKNMQKLLEQVSVYHDIQGAKMVSKKSYAGTSHESCQPTVSVSIKGISKDQVLMCIREWAKDHSLSKRCQWSLKALESKVIVTIEQDMINHVGLDVLRLGVKGNIECQPHHLTSILKSKGWSGEVSVENMPLHIVDVRSGKRGFLQNVGSTGSFRVLGLMLSVSLDWSHAIKALDCKVTQLQNMLSTAVNRKYWRTCDVVLAEEGKISGTIRFLSSVIPIDRKTIFKWDQRNARIYSQALGTRVGVSYDQLRVPQPIGEGIVSYEGQIGKEFILSMFSSLNGADVGGIIARLNLLHYQQTGGFLICPLAIPTHPFEDNKIKNCDKRWYQLREWCTIFGISIDHHSLTRLEQSPWQTCIPRTSNNSDCSITEIRQLLRKQGINNTKLFEQVWSKKMVGPFNSHRPMVLCKKAHQWASNVSFPPWEPTPRGKLWTTIVEKRTVHADENTHCCMVSDATVQGDGTCGFTCVSSNRDTMITGRCHFTTASSFEGEVCGIIASILWAKKQRWNVDYFACDNIGALIRIIRELTKPTPLTRVCLWSCPMIWATLHARVYHTLGFRQLKGMHVKAHVTDDITKGSLTYLQDVCDRQVKNCVSIVGKNQEFFTEDVFFGIFDTSNGHAPGKRIRILIDVKQWLSKQWYCILRTRHFQKSRGTRIHADGSYSWSEVNKIKWSKISLLEKKNIKPQQIFQWNRSYEVSDVGLKIKDQSSSAGDMYRRVSRLKTQTIAGRLPTKSSLCNDTETPVHMNCIYCSQHVTDNNEHMFQCEGDKFPGLPEELNFLRKRRCLRHITALFQFGTHGLRFQSRLGPDGMKPETKSYESHVSAQCTPVEDILIISSLKKSNNMYHEMCKVAFKRNNRCHKFHSQLAQKLCSDSTFRAPVNLLKRTKDPCAALERNLRSVASDGQNIKKGISNIKQSSNHRTIQASRFNSMNIHFPGSSSNLMSRINKLSLNKGSMFSPVFQEAVVRWIGLPSCVVAYNQWHEVWDIPLPHLHVQRDKEFFHHQNNWIMGPIDFSESINQFITFANESLNKGAVIVKSHIRLQSLKLPKGWVISRPFVTQLINIFQDSKKKIIEVECVLIMKQIRSLPYWMINWSTHAKTHLTFDKKNLTSKSMFLDSLLQLDWSRHSSLLYSFAGAERQGLRAGLFPECLHDSWISVGVHKKVLSKWKNHNLLSQIEWSDALINIRKAIETALSLWSNILKFCEITYDEITFPLAMKKQSIQLVKKNVNSGWQGSDLQGFMLDKSFFEVDCNAATSVNKIRLQPAPRSIQESINTMFSILSVGDDMTSCECGFGKKWVSFGNFTRLGSNDDYEAKCPLCRKGDCTRIGCLHCQLCGINIDHTKVHYNTHLQIVCKGCAKWITDRWPYKRMWKSKDSYYYAREMISRAGEYWLGAKLESTMVSGLSKTIFSERKKFFDGNNGILQWGWLLVKVGSILLSLDYHMIHISIPSGCDEEWQPIVPLDGVEILKWSKATSWSVITKQGDQPNRLNETWSEMLNGKDKAAITELNSSEGQSMRINEAALPVQWQRHDLDDLFEEHEAKHVASHLICRAFEIVDDVDSDADSVPGGEMGDPSDKKCFCPDCPFDPCEDAYYSDDDTDQILHLCIGCNRGVHSWCVSNHNNHSSVQWSIPQKDAEWRCNDCVDLNSGTIVSLMSCALDEGRTLQGDPVIIIRWTSSSEGNSIEMVEKLLGDNYCAAFNIIDDLRDRQKVRKDRGQDPYGRLSCASHRLKDSWKVHRIDSFDLDPGNYIFSAYKRYTPYANGDYHNWRLTHPSLRWEPLWSPVKSWKATVKSTRSGNHITQWNNYVSHCESSTIMLWYDTSKQWHEVGKFRGGLRRCPGPGMRTHSFISMIREELQWFPSEALPIMWARIGFSTTWEDVAIANRIAYTRQWTNLQAIGQWCRHQLRRLEEDNHRGLIRTTKVRTYVADIRKSSSALKTVSPQSRIVSTVAHMIEER